MALNRFDRTAYTGDPSDADADDAAAMEGGPEAVRRLQAQLEELGEYARFYASAKKDAILASARKWALLGLAGIAALAIFCTMLITAAVLALLGLAQWIGDALGDRLWAGYLIVGWGLLLLVAAGLAAAMVYLQRRFRTQTVNKYDKRRRNQRARFGHDLGQQARGEAERN
jgi:membrane protein implicated in regulation of membrane protease activity